MKGYLKPPVPVEKTVVIEMSEEEARHLSAMLWGSNDASRKFRSAVREALYGS